MNKKTFVIGIALLLLGLVGCQAFTSRAQESPQLVFEAAFEVSAAEEFHVSLGVRNEGAQAFGGDDQFNAQMEIRDSAGELRASAEVIPLQPLEPGETAWPMVWRGDLEPDTYRLTWGAEGYGSTTEEFTVVERDGRLYLADGAPPTQAPQPAGPEALIARAVEDLAERLGVDADEISVINVDATQFPDASLGVPQPGESYAQVVTPGYVIQLAVGDQLYEYHASEERMVFAAERVRIPTRYEVMTVADLGLLLEVPVDWEQVGSDLAWAADGADARVGFEYVALEPPMEIEAAMLPDSAQIVSSDPVNLEWASGRRFTLAVFGSTTEEDDARADVESIQTHVLLTVDRDGTRWGLDFYISALTADRLAEIEPVLQHMLDTAALAEGPQEDGDIAFSVDETEIAGWQTFREDEYGFQFRYPQDWTSKELSADGRGMMPEDWPVEQVMLFFPQAWAERFEQAGPPDPAAPPAVAPIHMEVVVGSDEQFRRAYCEPTRSDVLEVGRLEMVREEDIISSEARQIRYVFQDPDDAQLRVVFIDSLSGFSDRVEGNEEIIALIPQVLATFEFVE